MGNPEQRYGFNFKLTDSPGDVSTGLDLRILVSNHRLTPYKLCSFPAAHCADVAVVCRAGKVILQPLMEPEMGATEPEADSLGFPSSLAFRPL